MRSLMSIIPDSLITVCIRRSVMALSESEDRYTLFLTVLTIVLHMPTSLY